MAYTDIDDPTAYFQTKIYTGNATDATGITGVGFQPDMTWIKERSQVRSHVLFDVIRGATVQLNPNDTASDATVAASLQSFDSDGFTVGTATSVNQNTDTYVSWNWKAGTSVSGTTTGSGTGQSYSGSVNTDAGFSITAFTGNGTANHTLPHSLSSIPSMFIIKKRIGTGDATARDWNVYHQSLGNTKKIDLNSGNAASTSNEYWNNISPTSSVINLGTNDQINGDNNTYICYAFAEKQGYSKFKSYIGNNNVNGPLVYTGFKPAWVMLKSSGENGWSIYDNKRSPFNLCQNTLLANTTGVEQTSGGNGAIDILSNGFKIKNTDAGINSDGVEYIYMAFAENPFTTSTGVPATAR